MALYNKAMGTGAFKLQADPAPIAVLQRFDEYWRALPSSELFSLSTSRGKHSALDAAKW